MRFNSIRARLIFGAAIWISIGIGISGVILAHLFRELAISQNDHDLTDHLEELANLVDIDAKGVPFTRQTPSDARFVPPRSGVYWQIWLDGLTARSPSLGTLDLPIVRTDVVQQPYRIEGSVGTLRMMQKTIRMEQSHHPVQLAIGIEERLVDDFMRHLYATLALSLGILGLGLFGAALAQVEFGLRPFARIRTALNAIRTDDSKQLPNDLPVELAPLVNDLNALIVANREMVRRARLQAANFAHALKTPLTILMDEGRELAEAGQQAAAQVIMHQCVRMQQQIDYQTARARTSARANPGAVAAVGEVIKNVTTAISRLHRDRPLTFELTGPEDATVACDQQDLSEMMGNLVDNAAKWARSQIRISIETFDGTVRISVEDDGPGVPPEHFETVFAVGERLDERMPGSGLGLAITRDLATLYGGRIWIERSELGGVASRLELPWNMSPA